MLGEKRLPRSPAVAAGQKSGQRVASALPWGVWLVAETRGFPVTADPPPLFQASFLLS